MARRETQGVEARLGAYRPEPPDDLVRSVTTHVEDDRRRSRLSTLSRVSFAGALTVLMLGTLTAFGGLAAAASGTKSFVNVVKRTVAAPSKPRVIQGSAAQDQYTGKVTICHHTGSGKVVTITISESALPAHLRHGDTIGPCKGAVLAAAAARTRGAGALGATATGGKLPFTGFTLGGTVALSLVLIGTGVGLRRRAGSDAGGK